MSTPAHKILLDRGEARKQASIHLEAQITLFEDLANYGSMLLPRLIHTSKDLSLHDSIVIGVFLRQIVAMLDSFTVLLREGATHAAYLPARSAFEASLFSEWILASDIEEKTDHYYVQCVREERKWTRRASENGKEESSFRQLMQDYGVDLASCRPDIGKLADERINEIEKVLSQPQLAEINQRFERAQNKGKNVHWYQLLGVSSIRQLAKSLGRLGEYDVFYSKAASIHHSARYVDHYRYSDYKMYVDSVRHLRFATEQVFFIGELALRSYMSYLQYYRPREIPGFAKKYTEQWRDAFLGVPRITYDVD